MADPFKEIVPSILQTKVNYLRDDVDLKEYSPFMVNRALSYHMDCVLYANEMNKHHSIDKDMQYQYLLNTIRPMKRKFQPWQKSEKEKDIDCVKTYFSYSNQKAKDALRVLSKEQISQIKELVDIGGTQKNTK
jgi:hypothetical protein